MRRHFALAWSFLLAAAALTCHGGPATSTVPPSDPIGAPTRQAVVELDVNGRHTEPIPAVCVRGVFVSTRVKNVSGTPLALRRLDLRFESSDGRCQTHTPLIDPTIGRTLAAGSEQEVKVFDAAGSLCDPPTGGPGCAWHARATVSTDAGAAEGMLDFSTTSGAPRAGCLGIRPVVFIPRNGATVSGTVEVTASVPEDGGCVISARSRVWVYSDLGIIVAASGDLDFGSTWTWDTSRHPNGTYRIRASQNCCNALGDPIEVTVRN
jgi:Bacterial Ig domain